MRDIIIVSLFGIAALLFSFSDAFAGNYRTTHVMNNYVTKESSTTYVNDNKGVALAIAKSQHHFYLGTHDPQWSVGFGSLDDQHAISFSAGKKLEKVFVSGSIGIEGDEIGIGVGIGGKF